MELTREQLQQCIGNNPYLDHWYEALSKLLPDYEINTPQRIAAFLAQCAHESAGFTAIRENLNYRAETLMKLFGKYFPGGLAEAKQFEHNQEAIANRIYGGRMGNGPESSGDGFRYCGRGLIQLTGKANYQSFADSLQISPEDASAYLETFEGAAQSACWFWENNNLNQYADSGDITTMTKRINGGTLGLAERTAHYNHFIQILS